MQELGNFFIGKSFGRKKQKENRPENSQSGIFKSATTYFHKPFPANYLGHE